MTVFHIVIAIIMVAVAIALVSWFARYRAAGAERRMTKMLKQAGVAPEIAASGEAEAIMKEVRRRCRRCQSEDVCERWLTGEKAGDNNFCPNARVFEALAR
jgi:hypothetical protein